MDFTTSTIVIFLTADLAVVFVGLVGNVLVIIVVVKIPEMKTVTNYFILNLAIADLLVLIFWLSIGVITIIYPLRAMSLLCNTAPYIQGVAICASAYSLAAISGVRLMAVWFPLRRKVTKSVARRIIVLIWIWAAALALPRLFYSDLGILDDLLEKKPQFVCPRKWPTVMIGNIYFLVVMELFYLFPLTFISFCYFCIWLRLRRRNVPTDAVASQMVLVHQRTKASVGNLVMVVVAVFALCWLPLYVVWSRIRLFPKLSTQGRMEKELLVYALIFAELLGIANSCINPILYGFFNQNFRLALKRLFCGLPTYTRTRSCVSPHLLHNSNQAANCRTNLVRLITALQPSHRRSSQVKSTRHNTFDLRVLDVAMLDQKSPKPPAIPRSQTFYFSSV